MWIAPWSLWHQILEVLQASRKTQYGSEVECSTVVPFLYPGVWIYCIVGKFRMEKMFNLLLPCAIFLSHVSDYIPIETFTYWIVKVARLAKIFSCTVQSVWSLVVIKLIFTIFASAFYSWAWILPDQLAVHWQVSSSAGKGGGGKQVAHKDSYTSKQCQRWYRGEEGTWEGGREREREVMEVYMEYLWNSSMAVMLLFLFHFLINPFVLFLV